MSAITSARKNSEVATIDKPNLGETGQYLTFMLGGETFALGILNIREIIQFGDLTEVPMMPKFVRGVINLRGRVVPVVDLAARFNRTSAQVSRRTSIIIIELEQEDPADTQSIGIVVDAVNEVIDINAADIEPPPSFGAKIRPDFISGMAKKDGRFIIVLNLENVLSMDEMISIGRSIQGTNDTMLEAENESGK
ncbi:chemotaxis protein CheW [Undibacterium cyanobacteriorum]|uniref:Chemotaxis protein CheW n=1 Tax=Undibacterium cyanobacteriorum TaxID=3073561 RepID=A0ABY9RGM0_9BURK|nr:chemotaxis protein CheW [Undibacterium sp. 20NA77.5]WMW80376.1 chemotaxis protein CheW [Undibacterium sp. 20NA77.5]